MVQHSEQTTLTKSSGVEYRYHTDVLCCHNILSFPLPRHLLLKGKHHIDNSVSSDFIWSESKIYFTCIKTKKIYKIFGSRAWLLLILVANGTALALTTLSQNNSMLKRCHNAISCRYSAVFRTVTAELEVQPFHLFYPFLLSPSQRSFVSLVQKKNYQYLK